MVGMFEVVLLLREGTLGERMCTVYYLYNSYIDSWRVFGNPNVFETYKNTNFPLLT